MSNFRVHVIQGTVVLDKRVGMNVDRTHFDLEHAKKLRDEWDAAIKELEALNAK